MQMLLIFQESIFVEVEEDVKDLEDEPDDKSEDEPAGLFGNGAIASPLADRFLESNVGALISPADTTSDRDCLVKKLVIIKRGVSV